MARGTRRGQVKKRQLKTLSRAGKPQYRWDAVAYLGKGEDSKRQYKWRRGFRTPVEAEKVLGEMLRELDAGNLAPARKITVSEFIAHWLDTMEHKVRPSTFASYKWYSGKHFTPNLGTLQLGSLTAEMLTRLYARLSRDGLSPKTIRNLHGVISRALRDAVAWKYIPRNVAAEVTLPKRETPELQAWSPEELRAFLDHVRDDWLYPLWHLAVFTGMRRGELIGLRWADLDLDAGRLTIRKAKTSAGNRTIALDPTTVEALREHPRYGAHVFMWPEGREIDPNLITKWFRKHMKAAGLPPIRLHDLRASYITAAIETGVPPQVIAARVGHANTSITMNIYARVIGGADEDAATRVAAAILG